MREESDRLSYSLNTMDDLGQQLVQILKQIDHGQTTASRVLESFMNEVTDMRLEIDRAASRSAQLWQALLNLADRSLSTAESCSDHTRRLFETTFSQLGLSIFGLPGGEIDDLRDYEVVGSQGSSVFERILIVQTLRIGLRDADGNIIRSPRVVVSQEDDPTTGEARP